MQNRSVLISGLGVAGPTLAYWLLAHGFEPTIIEQAPRPRPGGYIIDFWGLGYDVAERMSLLPELIREGYLVRELRLVNERGQRVGGFQADVFRKLTGGRYLSLLRGDLAKALYRKIEPRCRVIFGDSITALRQQDEAIAVEFEHGPATRFDLVIGADGLHSQVRRLAFGPQEQFERYLGYVAAAFEARGYRPRDEDVYVSHSLPGKQIARFAMRGDRTMFLLVYAATLPPAADPHDTNAHKAALRREFAGAGWESPRILAALDESENVYFDRVSQIRMDSWSNGRIALVGDAAFCPSLLAGQGSALAMTAAYVLANELAAASGQYDEAFARYDSILRAFMIRKLDAAEKFATSFAPRTALGVFIRNQVTRLFGLPYVAELTLGRTILDRLQLPAYPAPVADARVGPRPNAQWPATP